MSTTPPKRRTDIGAPHHERFLPPVIRRNYGRWKYHERPRPGVLVHTAHSGEKLYTVRASSPRLLSIETRTSRREVDALSAWLSFASSYAAIVAVEPLLTLLAVHAIARRQHSAVVRLCFQHQAA